MTSLNRPDAGQGARMRAEGIALFALGASRAWGEKVAQALGTPLSRHEERQFEDGEHKARPLESVRGKNVYVIHSLYADETHSVNDKLCWLLFFLGALGDAGAQRITVIAPYLCYARKDRKTKPRDPVTTRYVAQLLESVGADRVVTMDVHNLAAFQNAFRRRSENLEARSLFARHFAQTLDSDRVAVVSPDPGGVKRAEKFADTLATVLGVHPAVAFMQKRRSEGVVSGEMLVGDVRGRRAIIFDDLIGTGTTLTRAANACRANGAEAVLAAATHGLFIGAANEALASPLFDAIVIADTVPPFRVIAEALSRKLTVLDTSAFFAEAIARLHAGGSIVDLVEHPASASEPSISAA